MLKTQRMDAKRRSVREARVTNRPARRLDAVRKVLLLFRRRRRRRCAVLSWLRLRGGEFKGSVEAGGSASIAFSIGGSGLVVSYSSPGNGRAFFVTGGGALFTGAVVPA